MKPFSNKSKDIRNKFCIGKEKEELEEELGEEQS